MGKKGTKKINRRVKRSARKTVGVLTLIMAIIVAAIPTPSARAVGGKENAASVTAPVYGVAQPTPSPDGSYVSGADDAEITNITPNTSDKTVYHSQKIYRIEGKYYLYTVFDYFMYKGPTDSAASGCIQKYYDSYTGKLVDSELVIPGTVTASYKTFTKQDVVDFFVGNNTVLTDADQERYYPEEWAKWELYDNFTKLPQEEQDRLTNQGNAPAYATKPQHTVAQFLDNNESEPWLDPAKEGRRYFCSHQEDIKDEIQITGEGDEYILYAVTDMSSMDGSGTTTLYIPVRVGQSFDAFDQEKDYSNQFYVPLNKEIPIGYIADRAFENASFQTLTIPQGVIQIIGNEAFVGSSIKNVSAWSGVIGNRAFKGCTDLESITLNTRQIGTECFYGCYSLTSITFPSIVEEIGKGAFANCSRLATVDMSGITKPVRLLDYCFFNCPRLRSVSFGDDTAFIGEAAFALTLPEQDTPWTEVVFPPSASELGDYVLYGRSSLEKVIMPASFGGEAVAEGSNKNTLKDGFFGMCTGLKYVEFPKNGCSYVTFGPNAFLDVESKDFYIRGPKTMKGGKIQPAQPRKDAWEAGITYVYNDTDGDHYEVSDREKGYRYAVDSKGVLTDCTLLDETPFAGEVTIPAKVGAIDVTGIGSNCFSEEIEKDLEVLKIEDGSRIASIAPSAFEGYPKLTTVYIGDSINEIGTSAFANCKKLENVIFSTPSGGYQNFKIGANAFSTGGDTLTFYGDIMGGYAPFDWAMSADNYMNRDKKMRVCYRSGTLEHPNLTVLYDNATGAVTLVDYPHYDGLKWSNDPDNPNGTIIERYERRLRGDYTDESQVALDELEYECLMNVLNVVIPAGVDSIDVKKFLENSTENGNNAQAYIVTSPYYTKEDADGDSKPIRNPYYETYRHQGLFNGYYGGIEAGKDDDGWAIEYEFGEADRNKYEQNPIGNDRIQTVTMNTVTYLPDRAFESCENLQSVALGSGMEDIGTAPFTGCRNLTSVGGNSNYPCQNGIIYETNDTGLTIVECLPARGEFVGSPSYPDRDDRNLSEVTQIKEGAFENCAAITVVDLSAATRLTQIPRSCFKGADNLYDVKLPESVDDIREESFATGNRTLSVRIPAVEVDIADNAFDKVNTVTLRSYEDSAVENYVDRKGSRFHFDPIDRKYSVQFVDYNGDPLPYVDKDGTEIYVQYIEHGYAAKAPEDPTGGPAGYVFDKWNRDFTEVTSDLVVTALYKWGYPDTSPGVLPVTSPGAGGNGNNGTPTPTPNGTPAPGSGTPGAGTPGAGTPGAGTPGASNNDQNSNQRYKLTVQNGSGSGTYTAGTTVVITADAPPSGQRFDRWTSIANDFNITSATSSITTITMPSHDMTIVANYTSGSGSSNGNNGNSTNISSNTNGNGNSGGTTVDITKPGISDTDVASATVEGSTDNYVVKITDTAEARAAVEAALINEYGTLDNLRYFAMDISLYDSTGTVKITDTSNLAVNITMPIPDELRLYAGNNQVAGVVNGNVLDKLSPRFTTINGIPCISFTATHFSPYTVYVDTSNLSAGVSDSTPKTGDMIHPKWFLAVALACISFILLLKKDKKQANVKAA